MKYSGEMIPNNFEELKKNKEYLYYLKSFKESHLNFITMSNFILDKIEELILNINNEVNNKSNPYYT